MYFNAHTHHFYLAIIIKIFNVLINDHINTIKSNSNYNSYTECKHYIKNKIIENIFTIILMNRISEARISDFDLSTLNISHLENIASIFLILFFKIRDCY